MIRSQGLGRWATMGMVAALLVMVGGVQAGVTALAHYDGTTAGDGKEFDFCANPQFGYWTTLGSGSQTVTLGAGQPGFNGALVGVPEAALVYTTFDSSPPSMVFASSGTIEMWICPAWNGANQGGSGVGGAGAGQVLFSHQYNLFGSDFGFQVFIFNNGWPNDGGQLFLWWVDEGGSFAMNNSPNQPSGDPKYGTTANWVAGQWHHVAVTWSPGHVRLFLDGGIVATKTPLGSQPFTSSGTLSLWVGGYNGANGFNGKLDELAIWDEIRYTDAFIPPDVPVTNKGTLIGEVLLGDYDGDPTDVNVTIRLSQGGTVVRTAKQLLSSEGKFIVTDVDPDTYDVSIKACAWLQKTVSGLTVPGYVNTDLGTITLTNGDTDGDNEVTTSDLATVLLNMDMVGD